MCGICGIINFNNQPVNPEKIRDMMLKIKHRGPDDEGIFCSGNKGFGFVRLSVIDLSERGHQPMFDSNNRYMIIHNGEIYNYIELRKTLEKKGYKFKSNTDTEVVLYSFIEWGEDCLNKFNGMWVFLIYDTFSNKIIISRDRFGIKPFYYYVDENQFIFASEIPAILSVLNERPEANNQIIFDYLVFNRTDHTESTFFQKIKKLQHGSNLIIELFGDFSFKKNFKFKIKRWYNLDRNTKEVDSFQSPEEFLDLLTSAVELRLRSDVPIGVCLSGGLDSSSIVSILLKRFSMSDVFTFSAVYEGTTHGDESEYINLYKKSLANMFFTTPTEITLSDELMRFIKVHGEPISSTSPYAQFKVMELAKNNVVVTLDGQGADESLGGYHYFFGYLFKELLYQLNILKLTAEILEYVKLHRSFYGLKTLLYFLLPNRFKTKTRLGDKGFLTREFGVEYSKNNFIVSNLYDSENLNQSLIDHFEFKLEHLLKWSDRNSMYFSIESRVPFLDYRLVEKLLASSRDKIIHNGWTKFILREAMKNILPDKIRKRKDKIGFITPEDDWFRTNLWIDKVNDILNSKSLKDRNIINPTKAQLLYNNHVNYRGQSSKDIWKMVNLELWFREFID